MGRGWEDDITAAQKSRGNRRPYRAAISDGINHELGAAVLFRVSTTVPNDILSARMVSIFLTVWPPRIQSRKSHNHRIYNKKYFVSVYWLGLCTNFWHATRSDKQEHQDAAFLAGLYCGLAMRHLALRYPLHVVRSRSRKRRAEHDGWGALEGDDRSDWLPGACRGMAVRQVAPDFWTRLSMPL